MHKIERRCSLGCHLGFQKRASLFKFWNDKEWTSYCL